MSGSREKLAERDRRMFEQNRAGVSITEIASRFGVSPYVVKAGMKRHIHMLNSVAFETAPEQLRVIIEQIDSIWAAIFPLTQHRAMKQPDGTMLMVEPDVRFVQQALSLIKEKVRILGLDQAVQQSPGSAETPRSSLAGAERPIEQLVHDPKIKALELIEVAKEAGIMDFRHAVNQDLLELEEAAKVAPEEIVLEME